MNLISGRPHNIPGHYSNSYLNNLIIGSFDTVLSFYTHGSKSIAKAIDHKIKLIFLFLCLRQIYQPFDFLVGMNHFSAEGTIDLCYKMLVHVGNKRSNFSIFLLYSLLTVGLFILTIFLRLMFVFPEGRYIISSDPCSTWLLLYS